MKLSIIICAYNEKQTILTVLDGVKAVSLGPGWEKEIIVVDNFSTDGTRELLKEAARNSATVEARESARALRPQDSSSRRRSRGREQSATAAPPTQLKVLLHPRNLGKGASIRTAIENCTGDYAIIQDADLEYDPAEIPRFLEKALSDGADAVYGSRTIGGKVKYIYARNYWGVRFLTSLTNLLFNARYTDVATASKMVRASVLKSLKLKCSGFDLDFELSNKLAKRRCRVIEIPITYWPRSIAEGKKIRAKDGLSALFQILKDRILSSPSRKGPPRP
jgi:glycosyltransferase involved in cell wall biosynthesis